MSETKIFYWYYREEQEIVYYNDEQDRAKREAFLKDCLIVSDFLWRNCIPMGKRRNIGDMNRTWLAQESS